MHGLAHKNLLLEYLPEVPCVALAFGRQHPTLAAATWHYPFTPFNFYKILQEIEFKISKYFASQQPILIAYLKCAEDLILSIYRP